jgi:hypothetical protein
MQTPHPYILDILGISRCRNRQEHLDIPYTGSQGSYRDYIHQSYVDDRRLRMIRTNNRNHHLNDDRKAI